MTKLSQLICILERNGENMKKFWLYLAVPAVLLNGCQRQRAALKEAESLAVESVESERCEGKTVRAFWRKWKTKKGGRRQMRVLKPSLKLQTVSLPAMKLSAVKPAEVKPATVKLEKSR